MSEQQPNYQIEDDLIRSQLAIRDSLLSFGAIPPDGAEELTIPLQERIDLRSSGRFMAFEEELASSPELTAELRQLDNEEFKQVLLDAGVVSRTLYDSGLLDRFIGDDMVSRQAGERIVETPVNGLKHIFLGDLVGGLHDFDSMEKSGLVGIETDTQPTKWKSGPHGTRIGNFNTLQPVDIDGDGTIDEHIDHELFTKTQFPEKWTADEVLLCIVEVSETPPIITEENKDGVFTTHESEKNGINMRVVMNNDKIMVAYPIKHVKPDASTETRPVAA